MKDLFELLGKIFSRNNKPKVKRSKHVCDEELYTNVNGCLDPNCPVVRHRQPLPKVPPPGPPPTPEEAALLKKKTRINELEKEIAELRAESSRQVELLEQLTRQLSTLQRSVAHLLPEK